MTTTAIRATVATPEPGGPRVAWCKHCSEMIRQERRDLPWFHVEGDDRACR